MDIHYKEYFIEVVDDPNYSLNSADNIISYSIEYADSSGNGDRFYQTSKHGIRISKEKVELKSAIICEIGGRTTIHSKSLCLSNNDILICCSDRIYSLSIPSLNLNWRKRFDPVTCFGIYPFGEDFIIHGELQISRIDIRGTEKWSFSAGDIFVTPSGDESIVIIEDKIKLKDWSGNAYLLDSNGEEIRG